MVDNMENTILSVSMGGNSGELKTPKKYQASKGYIEKNPRIFYQDLYNFHDGRNTPCTSIPKISGKEIDLHDLYNLVCLKGGWLKVTAKDQWDEILTPFKIPNCPNSILVMKQIYVRFLDQFEKVHFLGEQADRNEDEEEENRHKKWTVRALYRKSVPMVYNHQQHFIPDQLRQAHKLSTDFYRPTEYDKLLLSLMSPLPNEQDFAINVCTLMSNEEKKHMIRIDKCPRLVHVLLAHAGIFHHYTMRELFVEFYSKIRKHSLQAFWKDCLLEKPQILELSCDGFFNSSTTASQDADEVLSLRASIKSSQQNDVTIVGEDTSSSLFNLDDAEVLGIGRGFGTHDYIGQRVLQVASILRNLSFVDENVLVMSKNRTFLRFLVMCSNTRWNNLHHMALDMLGNIANELHLYDPSADELTRFLLSTICEGLDGYDRGVIISCLEILSKLSQRESNEEHLCKCLEQRLFDQLARFLCLNDIMLLIYTLECIYALTSLGAKSCSALMHCGGIVDTLVSLVTVEAQSYGPNACILMRVVETNYLNTNPYGSMGVAAHSSATKATVTQLSVHNEPISSIPATITMSSEQPKMPTNIAVIPQMPLSIQTISQAPLTSTLTTMTTPIVSTKTEVAAASPKPTGGKKDKAMAAATSKVKEDVIAASVLQQSTVAAKHAQQQLVQENEQFASLWLRSTLEPAPTMNHKVEQQEIYKMYITASSKIGRRDVCSFMHFPRIVRTVFGGSVGPTAQKSDRGGTEVTEYYYEGLKIRQRPMTVLQKGATTISMSGSESLPTTTSAQQIVKSTQVQITDVPVCSSPQPTTTTNTGSILVTQMHNKNVVIHQNQPQQQMVQTNTVDNKSVIVVTSQASSTPGQPSIILHQQGMSTVTQQQQTTSLIKTLLANKVTSSSDGSSIASTSTSAATNVSNCLIASNVNQLHQVTQRQNLQKQKQMAAEQTATTIGTIGNTSVVVTSNPQSSLSNIKLGNSTLTIKPNPNSMICVTDKPSDPPPLAPLSATTVGSTIIKPLLQKQLEDTNKTTVQVIGNTTIVKTNMGDKLVPGGLQSKITANKMLADLLDKKSSEPPAFNIVPDVQTSGKRKIDQTMGAGESEQMAKRASGDGSLDGGEVKPSAKLADLYAKLAGSILEDEDMEEEIKEEETIIVQQQQQHPSVSSMNIISQQQQQQQQSKMINVPMQRQIIVTPNNTTGQQMILSSAVPNTSQGTLPQHQQTIFLQHAPQGGGLTGSIQIPKQIGTGGQQQQQMIHQPTIVAGNQQQPTQYILATNQQGQTYVVAQHNPQQNHPLQQTLLLAQSPHVNQHSGTKTIIILQQQPNQANPGQQMQQINLQNQPQKLLMTTNQQGQQVFVTQMPTNNPQIRHQVILNPGGQLGQQAIVTNAQNIVPQQQQVIMQAQPAPQQIIEKKQIILTASGHIEAAPGTSIHQIQQQQQQQQQFVIQQQPNQQMVQHMQQIQQQQQPQIQQQQPQIQQQQSQVKVMQQKVGGQTITVQQSVGSPMGQKPPATPPPVFVQKTVPETVPTTTTVQSTQVKMTHTAVTHTQAPVQPPVVQPQQSPPATVSQTTVASTASVQTPATQTTATQPIEMIPEVAEEEVDINWLWVCNWRGCPRKKFKSANEVYMHACAVHCPSNIDPAADIYCQWGSGPGLCDNLPRKRFSLMTHIFDRHCTPESFKVAVQRRLQNAGATPQPSQPYPVTLIRQPTEQTLSDIEQPPPVNGPGNLSSAGSAALHAIKRHSIDFANARELQDDNEGPVTKSIRLTSALILRNLVNYSTLAAKNLRHYEAHLAGVALSNVESSRTIAQVLYDMNETVKSSNSNPI